MAKIYGENRMCTKETKEMLQSNIVKVTTKQKKENLAASYVFTFQMYCHDIFKHDRDLN